MNDIENPLEKLKVEQALRSEQMKLEYRQANKPNEVSILDVTVIEALKKQIPQECNTKVTNNGIDISGEYDIDNHYLCPICKNIDNHYLCPICKNVVGDFEAEEHYYDYCPDCGQKLDWSEE